MPQQQLEESPQSEMTFFEHVDALRPHLMRGAGVIVVLLIIAFCSKGFIIDTVLFGPQSTDFPLNRFLNWVAESTGIDALRINTKEFNMVNTSMAGQFNLHMTIAFATAIILGVPYLLWEVWRFVKPALTPSELRGSRLFVMYVSLCFFTGLLFGYYLISPLTVNFLVNYQASERITNMIDVSSYLSTVINVSLACAAVFQLPLLVYFLTRMGVLTPDFMRKYRRHAIMVLLIFSAIITPPDVFSQTLVMLPLYGLYEFSIHLSAKVKRKMDSQTI